jgi:hypothetical protein
MVECCQNGVLHKLPSRSVVVVQGNVGIQSCLSGLVGWVSLGQSCLSGLVWSGLVWSGLVWSGLVWSGLVWSGLVWSLLVLWSWDRPLSYCVVRPPGPGIPICVSKSSSSEDFGAEPNTDGAEPTLYVRTVVKLAHVQQLLVENTLEGIERRYYFL